MILLSTSPQPIALSVTVGTHVGTVPGKQRIDDENGDSDNERGK